MSQPEERRSAIGSAARHRASMAVAGAVWWAMRILIAVCVAADPRMPLRVASSR